MINDTDVDFDAADGIRYDRLDELLRLSGNIATIKMWTLRNIHGADRLGVNVIANIQERLSALGINYQPDTLPNNQYATALIFRKGSKLDKIMTHLRDIQDSSDEKLSELISEDQATKKIAKIRELICD